MIARNTLELADHLIRLVGDSSASGVQLLRNWNGSACRLSLVNTGLHSVRVVEVVVFALPISLPPATPFYGEGYNMLSQYKGTLSRLEDMTNHSDYGHYRFPQKSGFFTVYNLLMLFPREAAILMGFSSCHRFSSEFRFNAWNLEIVVDCEGLEVAAGETLELEEFFFATGAKREDLLFAFGTRIGMNHPRLPYPVAPTGWCSWYAYGPDVTEQDIFDNLASIKKRIPQLKFIQIDDGYQKHMGDWLKQHPNFPSPMKDLCLKIKDEGFEPAIWVAPFIADNDSDLFHKHPDWFIKDDVGKPLPSGNVTFGGWRFAPWYMLDGTHPDARDYLRQVFRTMREEWQCRYFKLDANLWGAMPFGHRHDPKATRVDAYRAGMEAVLEGAGEGSFILGCNAPMWPSFGLVHGMRVTNDVARQWKCFTGIAEEGFNRNWQNGSLWINDPDCIVLNNLNKTVVGPDGNLLPPTNILSEDEFSYHAAYILASGGMVLASDRMMDLNEKQIAMLARLIPANGQAAIFDDRTFEVGRIKTKDGVLICLFNKSDTCVKISVPLGVISDVTDFWTGDLLDAGVTKSPLLTLAPHSARVLKCTV